MARAGEPEQGTRLCQSGISVDAITNYSQIRSRLVSGSWLVRPVFTVVIHDRYYIEQNCDSNQLRVVLASHENWNDLKKKKLCTFRYKIRIVWVILKRPLLVARVYGHSRIRHSTATRNLGEVIETPINKWMPRHDLAEVPKCGSTRLGLDGWVIRCRLIKTVRNCEGPLWILVLTRWGSVAEVLEYVEPTGF